MTDLKPCPTCDRAEPTVKQLVWVRVRSVLRGRPTSFRAKAIGFWWEVDEAGILITNSDPTTVAGEKFPTVKDAKAAAQADFERRVKECLV